MTGHVTVACKLPNGLVLRAFTPLQETVQKRDGSSEVITVYRESQRCQVRGSAIPVNRDPDRDYPQVLGGPNGYALTHGVPADLWNSWLESNKDTDMVRNKLVFASEKPDMVRAQAKECAAVKSGLEPLAMPKPGTQSDPDPRMPRRVATFKAA